MTNNDPSGERLTVLHADLAKLLRSFRKRRDESRSDVETRLALIPRSEQSVVSGGVHHLETASNLTLELSLGELETIAKAYEIPRLMLDPLLVNSSEPHCLLQTFDELKSIKPSPDGQHGVGTTYALPRKKLSGTEDVALLYLRLEKGGHSSIHSHPGDELMFVLKGTISVRFADNGLWTELNQGDYTHFYAEQRHAAWNAGDKPAEVLVIRFYQLRENGTRRRFLAALQVKKKERPVIDRAIQESIEILSPAQQRRSGDSEIADRVGLGRLLSLLCSKEFRPDNLALSLNRLFKRAQEAGLDYSRARLGRLHSGHASVPLNDLLKIAQVHDVEPLLLFDFVYPAWRTTIAVRQSTDYRKIPEHLSNHSEVSYRVPTQRLAHSDISIVRLEMDKNRSTPKNTHPGHELVVPLSGSAEVRIGQLNTVVEAGKHLFAHFQSSSQHQVLHRGIGPARLLVIRFYV